MSFQSVDISSYGGSGDGVTDNTPALNAAVADAYSRGIREIVFGIGRFAFNTPPNPILSGMHIRGTNRPETMLIRRYSSTVSSLFLQWQGGQVSPPGVYGGTGGGVRDMHIMAGDGTAGGIGLYPNAISGQPNGSMFLIDNIEICSELNGTGVWDYSLYVDGSRNLTQSFGIRDIRISRSDFMNGTVCGVFLNNVVACYMRDVGVYGGSYNGVPDIYVYGVTQSAPNTSTEVIISGAIVNGILHLQNCSYICATGIFQSGVSATGTSNCIVNGIVY